MRRLAHGVGVLVAASVALTAPNASARRWLLQATPRSSLLDSLDAVACSGVRACTAVGSGSAAGSIAAESWDGKRWRVARLPTGPDATASEIGGVSCVSAVACEAVGFSETGSLYAGSTGPLGERWNGRHWTLQRIVAPGPVANLSAVSCAAADACMAVGNWGTDDADQALLAERWNGKRWSSVEMRSPGSQEEIEMNSVSCPARNACIAVGDYTPPGLWQVPLAERWNGRSWAIEETIDPNRRADVTLSSVSCASRPECVAVGNYAARGSATQVPLAEQRNRGLWALYTLPGTVGAPLRPASLAGVSCRPGGPCSAVGTIGATGPGGPGGQTLAERWIGTNWSVRPTPSPAPSDELLAVSCPSATSCFAVGDESDMAGDNPEVLIERLS
ncbi:MAG: hypothetical protein M3Z06_13095 [Actinomycetota bacterium]|nr:hypothetical protein [Actinomycetota bacterium]